MPCTCARVRLVERNALHQHNQKILLCCVVEVFGASARLQVERRAVPKSTAMLPFKNSKHARTPAGGEHRAVFRCANIPKSTATLP